MIIDFYKRGGGGSGTTDYTQLNNKPQINSTELNGNKSLSELGIQEELQAGEGIAISGNTISANGLVTEQELDELEISMAGALNHKQDTLVAGSGINIANNVIREKTDVEKINDWFNTYWQGKEPMYPYMLDGMSEEDAAEYVDVLAECFENGSLYVPFEGTDGFPHLGVLEGVYYDAESHNGNISLRDTLNMELSVLSLIEDEDSGEYLWLYSYQTGLGDLDFKQNVGEPITIGETTLDETQLQALLALIQN